MGNKSPAPFLKKPLCMGDLSPACKIFIERPVIATEPNLSIFILAHSHVLSLCIAEKLRSHSAEVIGNIHAIFKRTNKLGNLFSSHFVIAFANVSGQSLKATANHLRC